MKKRATLRSGRKAISLIEILIAITIIGILAYLLLPAMKRMIEKSQQATCMGNLRTLAAGANLFATDNNGFLPWYGVTSSIRWETQIAPYVGDYKVYHRWDKVWHPSGPFTCPATSRNWWLGYGWNYHGLGMSAPPSPIPPGKDPKADYTRFGPTLAGSKSKVVMMADSYYASHPTATVPEGNNALPPPGKSTIVQSPHSGGLNTVFVDGHVEWCQSEEWYKFKFIQPQ